MFLEKCNHFSKKGSKNENSENTGNQDGSSLPTPEYWCRKQEELCLLQDNRDVPTCSFRQYLSLINMDGGWRKINTKLNGLKDKLAPM